MNRAARLPFSQQSGSEYRALYQEGPLLFNSVAVDPVTGEETTLTGGLVVSERRLAETLAKLQELGFEAKD